MYLSEQIQAMYLYNMVTHVPSFGAFNHFGHSALPRKTNKQIKCDVTLLNLLWFTHLTQFKIKFHAVFTESYITLPFVHADLEAPEDPVVRQNNSIPINTLHHNRLGLTI